MTYSEAQQNFHRKAFIDECRQKAWATACHADWIGKNLDELLGRYTKMQEEVKTLEAESKELENALDYHTVDNRGKRKGMQEKRDALTREMQTIAKHAADGQKVMRQLLQSVESSLELAAHAEKWEWKEVDTKTKEDAAN